MRHYSGLLGVAGLAAVGLGCAIGTGTGAPLRTESGPVEVRVENRSWADAAIYLASNGLVHRIGFATAAGTTTLWVPARLLGPSSDVRIISAPIGSNRFHATDPLLVRPGQLVQLTLDNGMGLSSWGVW